MKHFSILGIGALVMLGMASCSDDANVENPTKVDGDVSYISVNLVTNLPGTRVDDPSAPGEYEEGLPSENVVNKVRFYFFDSDGAPFYVDSNNSQSYFDATLTEADNNNAGQDMENVAKILTTTATIVTDGTNFPSQMVIVLNPSADASLNAPSLDGMTNALNGIAADFNTTTGGFVMSNSVYPEQIQGTDGTTMATCEANQISQANFYNTAEGALANPVNVYVERVLAKVTMDIDTSSEGLNGYKTVKIDGVDTDIYPTGVTYNGNEVYVRFIGWNVTANTQTSYLMKHINPSWSTNLFGTDTQTGIGEPWFYTPYFRSYWALNPDNVEYGYGNFNGKNATGETVSASTCAQAVTSFDNGYTYVQENAATNYATGAGASHPTQVIVAAQLCDSEGKMIQFAEWAYGKYAITALPAAFLEQIQREFGEVYIKSGNTYSQLTENDLKLVTAGDLQPSLMDWQEVGRYYTYVQLKDADAEFTLSNASGAPAEAGLAANINTYLKSLGGIKIWNEGNTYYYFTIEHLGANSNDAGFYGVVRNHVYKATINGLSGLGTPVYDPTQTIYPEMPKDENGYIAAKINVLSWRIISQEVNFAW